MHPCRWGFDRVLDGTRAALVALALLYGAAAPLRAAELYDALGGQAGLRGIVHGMLLRASADPRITAQFQNISLDYLELHLVARLCAWTGGPCPERGPSMRGAHAELNLADRHFNALVEDLEAAMDAEGVSYRTQNRLLSLLAPMRRDVVGQ